MNHDSISGDDRIAAFLRQNMIAKFCLQWPQFNRMVEKFGEDEIIKNYSEQLAGRGYKASEIKNAIQKSIEYEINYPKPYAFAQMIKSPSLNNQSFSSKKLTVDELNNISRIIKETKNNNMAKELHRQYGLNFKDRPGDTKQQVRAQIEKVAEQLLQRPLIK